MNPELMRRVAKISGREYGFLRSLAEDSYLNLDAVEGLLKKVVADRMELARQYLNFAKAIRDDSEFHFRQIISRGYYAMHHAARAVIFESRREDIASHEDIIREIERIFGRETSKILKEQLRLRNNVEYEVYIKFDIEDLAQQSVLIATDFVSKCDDYLKRR